MHEKEAEEEDQMSFDDDNEQVDFEFFGFKFRATHAEQRQLQLKLSVSPQSRDWGMARNTLQILSTPAIQDNHRLHIATFEDAEIAMTKLAYKLIEDMIKERRS